MDTGESASKRNPVESFLRWIPGFRGYLDKEYRRDSDALTRQWLADRLQRSKRGIDELTRSLADAGQVQSLPPFDRLRGRLDKLIGRIRGAMRGYSGFFDPVQIDEARLDDIYNHDLLLMDEVEVLGRKIEGLPQEREQLSTALPDLVDRIDRLEQRWNARENLLQSWEEPLEPLL